MFILQKELFAETVVLMATGTINREAMKDLHEVQSMLFDKASTYTKLIFGLAYGGFFAFWSGTKQYLTSKQIVTSALLVTISLVLFVLFEILNAATLSHLAIKFSKSVTAPVNEFPASLERFQRSNARIVKALAITWYPTFFCSLISGLAGVGILLWGWVHWLYTAKR